MPDGIFLSKLSPSGFAGKRLLQAPSISEVGDLVTEIEIPGFWLGKTPQPLLTQEAGDLVVRWLVLGF